MTIDSLVLVLVAAAGLMLLPMVVRKRGAAAAGAAAAETPGWLKMLSPLAAAFLVIGLVLLATNVSDSEPPDAVAPLPGKEQPKDPDPPLPSPPTHPGTPAPGPGNAGSELPAGPGGTRAITPERESAGPPTAPPKQDGATASDGGGKWRLVPVYFGTDRKPIEGNPRLEFGPERARRLELGRALVSVPSSHDVPNIERPWAITIPFTGIKVYEETEDPAKHFTMREIKTMSHQELLALVRERLGASTAFEGHALIFVHGFNTSFDNAVYRTAQIANDLKFDGAPFLYSWPSRGGVSSYTYDRASAEQSEPYLRQFAEMVVKESGAKSVSVIAHSMGNQLVLRVLKDLKAISPDVAINQIILAAPDVDRDSFENIARDLKGMARGITLYAAGNDRALGISRNFHGGVPRAGDVPPSGPVVVEGVDTIDVTAVSTDSLALNHSSYAEKNMLLDDIARILKTGERPPDRRIPTLARVPGPKGEYWRYPAP